VHTALGIWALYERRQFRWKAIEPLQLVLGLSVPMLVIAHIIGVRLGQTLYGHEKLYPQVLFLYWVSAPYRIWLMLAVMTIAWVHGCIGLYLWLRMKAFFKRAAPFLLAAAVLIPTLAMLGFYQGGRKVIDDDSREWRAENLTQRQVGTREQQVVLDRITDYALIFYFGLIGIALLAKGARAINERRRGMVSLSYGNGRTVRVPKGLSVLEGEPAQQRAACQRVRRPRALLDLPHPHHRRLQRVARALAARGVRARPGRHVGSVDRLACQLRPATDLSFFQLFLPHTAADGHGSNPTRIGQERYLVNMFVDMRGSTKLAEKRLPFDTVFIVNRFLGAVSQAVLASGGMPNQFVGDGMLALFGLATSRQEACRQALRAAAMIAANVDELNKFLEHDLREPIRFGIGINGGEVIVGDIGYRDHMVFTALGDAVNVAARLQDMTKSLSCEVVVSDEVRAAAGLPPMHCRSMTSRFADATSR
jgi:adenylate cyclase